MLIIDDGSQDKSTDICETYRKNDKRIKILKKKNGGLSDARNYGIKHAIGTYIVFIDGDDYVNPNYLEKLYNGIRSSNAQVALCGFNMVFDEGYKNKHILPFNEKTISGKDIIKNIYDESNPERVVYEVAWNKIYRREIFSRVEFKKGRYFEDEFIIVPMFWNIDKVAIIHSCLYNYVQRKNSIMSSKISTKKIKDMMDFRIDRIKFFSKKNETYFSNLAMKNYRNWIFMIMFQPIVYSDKKKVKRLQNDFRKFFNYKADRTFKEYVKDTFGFINLEIITSLLRKKMEEK